MAANTVTRIENGSDAKQSTIDSLQWALEAAGVEFIDETGGGPVYGCESANIGTARSLPFLV